MGTTTAARDAGSRRAMSEAGGTVFAVLFAISLCHLINDMLQALLPAVYPILARNFRLSYGQIGLITFAYQMVGSVLQPAIGLYTDRHPKPWSLALGMTSTLVGLVVLARAPSYGVILLAAVLVGLGSAVFHPESSRVARLASGGRHGMAQSLFQVGGNAGTALGPLLAAFIVLPYGQHAIAWFGAAALAGVAILQRIGVWYGERVRGRAGREAPPNGLSRARVAGALGVLALLVFSKYVYLGSLTNYYTFYLIARFGISVRDAQLHLFLFLGAVAAGTFAGGPIGDRIGRRAVIWVSILGVLPFTLLLPHVGLAATSALTVVIGLILSSAFSAIVVYAQELMPGNVGAIAGLFFGLAFGIGGLGAAALGAVADMRGIEFVYEVCAWLPAIGIVAILLPRFGPAKL